MRLSSQKQRKPSACCAEGFPGGQQQAGQCVLLAARTSKSYETHVPLHWKVIKAKARVSALYPCSCILDKTKHVPQHHSGPF